jgi:hypothetical protein
MINKILKLTIALSTFFITISFSQNNIIGKYRTNFATYGMFGKTLTLKCDSSMIMNFTGDLLNDDSYGIWKRNVDTLRLIFDTINYPNSRYRNEMLFLIDEDKLYTIAISKSKYLELVRKIKESGSDTTKILSYEEFTQHADYNMSNYSGTLKRQYFIKFEQVDCKE